MIGAVTSKFCAICQNRMQQLLDSAMRNLKQLIQQKRKNNKPYYKILGSVSFELHEDSALAPWN